MTEPNLETSARELRIAICIEKSPVLIKLTL